jgi:hypothetical protein
LGSPLEHARNRSKAVDAKREGTDEFARGVVVGGDDVFAREN